MTYRFLEDIAIADAAFEIETSALPDLFSDAARALAEVQIANLQDIHPQEHIPIEMTQTECDLLLYNFLQELIYHKDVKRWILLVNHISVEWTDEKWKLCGELTGEKIDPDRHEQRVDAKAITLHEFFVKQTERGWKARVVVDI